MRVQRERTRLEWLFLVAALLLVFATSFANQLLVVVVAVGLLVAGLVLFPDMRHRGLIAAGLAVAAAFALVRLAQSFW